MLEASDVDCFARVGFSDVLASVVDHEPSLALVHPRYEHVVHPKGAFLHDHCRGYLSALLVDVRLDNEALGVDCVVLEEINPLLSNLLDLILEEI